MDGRRRVREVESMFLNQVHYIGSELRRSRGLRVAALLLGPLLVFGVLALLLQQPS